MISMQRIIHDDAGNLIDHSLVLNRYSSSAAIIPAAANEYLYIGSDLPFNSRYFEVSASNDQLSTVSIEIWTGSSWVSAVDVLDNTEVNGVAFSRSGWIRWTLDRNEFWGQESSTENIPALSSLRIYDFYWSRLKFSGNLNSSTSLKYVGYKFSNDDDFSGRYNDLTRSELLEAYKSGKTNWNEQHIAASEDLIMDVKSLKSIWHPNQILDHESFATASCHRAAEIIFSNFGDDYDDQRKLALVEYKSSLKKSFVPVDRNEDGKIDTSERRYGVGVVRT